MPSAAACSCFTAVGAPTLPLVTPATPWAAAAALSAAAKDAPPAFPLLLMAGSTLGAAAAGAFLPRLLGCSALPFSCAAAAAKPSVLTTTVGAAPFSCASAPSCFAPASCACASAVSTCAAAEAFLALPALLLGPSVCACTGPLLGGAIAAMAARLGMLLLVLLLRCVRSGCRRQLDAVPGSVGARGDLARLRDIRHCLRPLLITGSCV